MEDPKKPTEIQINSDTAPTPHENTPKEEGGFNLNIQVPHQPDEIHKKDNETIDKAKNIIQTLASKITGNKPAKGQSTNKTTANHFETDNSPMYSRHANSQSNRNTNQSGNKGKISYKIWNFLEWMAMSALIFVVFFFIINFSAYSTLIKAKLEKVTGNFEVNPYIEKIINQESAPTPNKDQAPLPITENQAQSVQQIPSVAISVAPPDERIIIPRINKNVPIIQVSTENLIKRDWNALENEIQDALKEGVVHYPGTADPAEEGNVVITGHSSYFPWDPGRFKDVFALLHEVAVGDEIVLYSNQKQYKYQVYETRVVTPDKVDVLTQEGENRLTLITCTPVGTNLKRLIVLAKPVK